MSTSSGLDRANVASEALRIAVDGFVHSIGEDYIDYPKERVKAAAAEKALKNFDNACAEVELCVISEGGSAAAERIEKLISELRGGNAVYVESLRRGMYRLNRRKVLHEKCSPLTRIFISPRAKRWDPWMDEHFSPRNEGADISCFLIVLVVFVLFATGSLLSTIEIGQKDDTRLTRLESWNRMNRFAPNLTEVAASLGKLAHAGHAEKSDDKPCSAELHEIEL